MLQYTKHARLGKPPLKNPHPLPNSVGTIQSSTIQHSIQRTIDNTHVNRAERHFADGILDGLRKLQVPTESPHRIGRLERLQILKAQRRYNLPLSLNHLLPRRVAKRANFLVSGRDALLPKYDAKLIKIIYPLDASGEKWHAHVPRSARNLTTAQTLVHDYLPSRCPKKTKNRRLLGS